MYSITHSGILGMHWGKRNGPPYPLKFKDLSEEERSKAKEETIRKGDIKTANYNKDYYTNKELEDVISRFNINQKISDLNEKTTKTGLDTAVKALNKIGKMSDGIENGIKGYNTAAKLMNSLFDAELPRI